MLVDFRSGFADGELAAYHDGIEILLDSSGVDLGALHIRNTVRDNAQPITGSQGLQGLFTTWAPRIRLAAGAFEQGIQLGSEVGIPYSQRFQCVLPAAAAELWTPFTHGGPVVVLALESATQTLDLAGADSVQPIREWSGLPNLRRFLTDGGDHCFWCDIDLRCRKVPYLGKCDLGGDIVGEDGVIEIEQHGGDHDLAFRESLLTAASRVDANWERSFLLKAGGPPVISPI